jgi:tetratricopeptide (TPR) repeat protein
MNQTRQTIKPKTFGKKALLLFAFVLLVFLPSLQNDFTNYDDPTYVTENPRVKEGLTGSSIKWALFSVDLANWHPLTLWSHQLDVSVYGLKPWGHHLTSALIHALSAVALYFILLEMGGAGWWPWGLAAIFALHPLRVESVVWVAERKDVLSVLFGLLSVLFYLKDKRAAQGKAFWFWMSLVSYAFSLMSKSMLVTLPVLLLVLDYWPLQRKGLTLLRLVGEKMVYGLLAVMAAIITLQAQSHVGAVKSITMFPLDARALNACVSVVRYLGKMLVPVQLAVFYPHPIYWPWTTVALSLGAIGLISWSVWHGRSKHPSLLLGWTWYIVSLLPVLGLIQVGAQSMADRYTYWPMIGLIMALLPVGESMVLHGSRQRWILGVAVLLLGLLTVRQMSYWKNSVTLFTHACEATGVNPVARMNLGLALYDDGKQEEGLRMVIRACEEAPRYQEAWLNRGILLQKMRRPEEALEMLKVAEGLNARSHEVPLAVGQVMIDLNRPQEAVIAYQESLKRCFNQKEALNNLGAMMNRMGKSSEALPYLKHAVELDPDYVDALQNLGQAEYQLDQYNDGLVYLLRAKELKPKLASIRQDLGGCLWMLGRQQEAIQEYEAGLALEPGNAAMRQTLEKLRQLRQQNSR